MPKSTVKRVTFSVGLGRGFSQNISPSRAYHRTSAREWRPYELLPLVITSFPTSVSTDPCTVCIILQEERVGSLPMTTLLISVIWRLNAYFSGSTGCTVSTIESSIWAVSSRHLLPGTQNKTTTMTTTTQGSFAHKRASLSATCRWGCDHNTHLMIMKVNHMQLCSELEVFYLAHAPMMIILTEEVSEGSQGQRQHNAMLLIASSTSPFNISW